MDNSGAKIIADASLPSVNACCATPLVAFTVGIVEAKPFESLSKTYSIVSLSDKTFAELASFKMPMAGLTAPPFP
jgi:hypothetical protein